MLDRVDQLLANREAQHPQRLLEARDILLEIDEKDNPLVDTRLSEAFYWLGEYSRDNKEKDTYHAEGVSHGKQAVESDAGNVAAHLWYAANMGSHGLVRGVMSSLFYLKPIQTHGAKALELDETFFFGAPLRLMGRFFHQCPSWPIGPGDLKKAVDYLERAVDAGEEFLLNKYFLADALLAQRKRLQARDLLRDILAEKDPQPFPLYQAMIQDLAKVLLEKSG